MTAAVTRRDAPERTTAARERRDVFVSYAREDAAFVRRLHARLVESGKKVYVDFSDIPPWSDDWQADLYRQIEASDTFVLVLSRKAVTSPHVGVEVDHAAQQGKRLRPLQLEAIDEAQVRPAFGKPQWLDFRDESSFDERFATLLEVLNTDVAWVQTHTRFLLEANDWDARGRDRSLLLGRSDLRDADEWLARQASKDPPPTELHTEFILASRRAAAVRRQIVLGAVTFALVVAIGLAILALVQRGQAIGNEKSARSRELAARALATLPEDPAASVQLAAQGVRTRDTAEAEDALRTSIAQSRLRHILVGHKRYLIDASFSPNGKLVVTASADGTARIWNAASGDEIAILPNHPNVVADASFSPDGKLVVTASTGDGFARVWSAETGKLVATVGRRAGALTAAAFSPDGRRVLTAEGHGTVRIWNLESRRQVAILKGPPSFLNGVAFSPNGKLVVTVGATDFTIRVWDVKRERAVAAFRRHWALEKAVAFSPDSKLIVTSPLGRPPRVSNAANGHQVVVLRGATDNVQSVAFSPNGKLVVTASEDGTARVWETHRGKEVGVLRGHTQAVTGASFSPDGTLIVTTSEDGTARVWGAGSWRQVAVLRGGLGVVDSAAFSRDGRLILTLGETARLWEPAAVASIAHVRGITWRSAFSPDGKLLAIATLDDTVRVRTVLGGTTRAVLRGHEDYLTGIVFSPDGKRLLTSSADGTARIWRADTGDERATLVGHTGVVMGVAFSPDGKLVLTSSEDGTARLWRAATGESLAVLPGQASIGGAWFSPDGERVLTQGYDRATLWDLNGQRLMVLHGRDITLNTVSFSPDGRRVITASPEGVTRVWDAASGRQTRVLRGPTDVEAAVDAPDGHLLVTNGGRVWDVETGQIVATLNETGGDAVPSPDGALILATTNDGPPRLLKAATGEQLAILPGYPDGAVGGAFSPDGTRIIVTGEDNTARVYKCRPCGSVDDLLRVADGSPEGG